MGSLAYESFGPAFVSAAVTPSRIVAAVMGMTGDTVKLGPMRAGPVGAAVVTARGAIGEPEVQQMSGDILSYSIHLPVHLSIYVRVGAVGRFEAKGSVDIRMHVRTELEPLAIVIDVDAVTPADVAMQVHANNVPSKVMQIASDVHGQMRQQIADYANAKITGPDAARLTRIDLVAMIDTTWDKLRREGGLAS